MAKKGEARENITLSCTKCKNQNYREEKNKRNTPERLEKNKYCKTCNTRTLHKEQK